MDREGFRDEADTFLGGGLLYSNLMASLILALLEAVEARDMDLVFWPGLTERLRVLLLLLRLPLLTTLLDLSFFFFCSDKMPGSRGRSEFLHLSW